MTPDTSTTMTRMPSHQSIGIALTALGALVAGGSFALLETTAMNGHSLGTAGMIAGFLTLVTGVMRTIVPDYAPERPAVTVPAQGQHRTAPLPSRA